MNGASMTVENFNTIKQYVLTLGGFNDTAKLDLQIEMIIDEVLAYCYRTDVPECMELPLADVIVTQLNSISSSIGIDGNITSYREGDMSITYGSVTGSNGAAVKYGGKLEGFKKIIGVIECLETTDAQ